MLLTIPGVLDATALAQIRGDLAAAPWADGNATSGAQSALAKRNLQLPEAAPEARALGAKVLDALERSALFVAAALPLKVYPPLFNRYDGGAAFGTHVDNAIRIRRDSDFRLRADLSATLFLTDPADYDGGELVIEGHFGTQPVKLPAGDLVLYPSSSLHRVTPVTRGTRLASFLWIQSMIRGTEDRRHLFELDCAVQSLAGQHGQGDARVIALTGVYHNLLRRFAEV